MTIRPVDLGGMLQRTDDIGALKHQEDTKPIVDQQNIQYQGDKNEREMMHQVKEPNQNEKLDNHTDAREEGKGRYDKSRSGKKSKKKEDGKVVEKSMVGGFDIKI